MTREAIRAFCLSLPHVTAAFKMHHAAFQIGGKTFAMLNPEVEGLPLCFKYVPEDFPELIEIEGVVQAPYMAKTQWVAIQDWDTLPVKEIKAWLTKSRDLTVAKLSKKLQTELS